MLRRLLEDDQVDGLGVYGGRPPQRTSPNSRSLDHPDPSPAAADAGVDGVQDKFNVSRSERTP
jgi:hypothetical protein